MQACIRMLILVPLFHFFLQRKRIERKKRRLTIRQSLSFLVSPSLLLSIVNIQISQKWVNNWGLEYVIFNSKEIYLPAQHIDHITNDIYGCPWSIILSVTHITLKIIDYVSAILDEWIIKYKFEILSRDTMPVVFTRLLDFFSHSLSLYLFLLTTR